MKIKIAVKNKRNIKKQKEKEHIFKERKQLFLI